MESCLILRDKVLAPIAGRYTSVDRNDRVTAHRNTIPFHSSRTNQACLLRCCHALGNRQPIGFLANDLVGEAIAQRAVAKPERATCAPEGIEATASARIVNRWVMRTSIRALAAFQTDAQKLQ